MDMQILERFWSKVNKPSPCWTWTSSITPAGYGDFHLNGKTILAHRLAWMLANGEIPEGKHVLHRCDNPSCVNPIHLFIGTHMDNMQDCRRKNRTGRKCGDENLCSKVSEDDIKEMTVMYASGEHTQKQIAEKFNLHPATISRMVRGLGRRKQIDEKGIIGRRRI